MSRFRIIVPLLFFMLLLAACLYRSKISFHQSAIYKDTLFFSRIPEIAKKMELLKPDAKQEGDLTFYRVTFLDRLIENGNVVDHSNVNEIDSSRAVPYGLSVNTHQELYLVNIPMSNDQDNIYVYYSLNYNLDDSVVGFGPAYLGKLISCPSDKNKNEIAFFTTLKSPRKPPFIWSKDGSCNIVFMVEKQDSTSIMINKIIEAGPNKIGGVSPVIFNVDSILGHGRLNFKIVKQ